MSVHKFFAERGQGVYRTSDGHRIRVNRPIMLKREEEQQLVTTLDAETRVFDMAKPDDVQDYAEVLDRIVNRDYRQIGREYVTFCQETGNYKILLRWAVVHKDLPPHLRNRFNGGVIS